MDDDGEEKLPLIALGFGIWELDSVVAYDQESYYCVESKGN